MEKNRFYKYVFVNDTENGSYLDIVPDKEFYHNATCPETVRFFKGFGKCYFRHCNNYDVFYTSCNNHSKTYRYYNTLSDLIKNEGLFLQPLQTGKNTLEKSFYNKAFVIVDKNGINKGLQSYSELVCSFHSMEYIRMFGYFSKTTTRHIDAYVFPSPMNYKYKGDTNQITRKVLEKKSCMYFDI